jgi:predicted RNA-binding Zn-ribbon protein involved in translation (DUF1610 family)
MKHLECPDCGSKEIAKSLTFRMAFLGGSFLCPVCSCSMYEFRARRKQMTGEWIVYQKYEGKNYYLTLGLHADDGTTYNHVKLARKFDFPFLPDVRSN